MTIINAIEQYIPFNEQEEKDKQLILDHLRHGKHPFDRDNTLAHMTASAWVVNHDYSKVLMVYHNLYDSWSWMGGHADGDEDLYRVAIKEVLEESGLSTVKPVNTEIFSLESLTVDGHERRGHYVSSHLHLNVTYLLQANEAEPLVVKPDENSDVAWFLLDDGVAASSEPWFQKRIYTKLNQKIKNKTII